MTELYELISLEIQKPIWGLEDVYFNDWGYLLRNAEEACRAKKQKGKYILTDFASEQALIDVVKYVRSKGASFITGKMNPLTFYLLWHTKKEMIDEANSKYGLCYIFPSFQKIGNKAEENALIRRSEVHFPKMPKSFKPCYYQNEGDTWGEIFSKQLHYNICLYNGKDKCAFSFYGTSLFAYFAGEAYKVNKATYIVCGKKLISAKEAKFITDTIGLTITRR